MLFPFRQNLYLVLVQEHHALLPALHLLVANIAVFVGGGTGQGLVVADNGGTNKDQQVGFCHFDRIGAEQAPQERYIPQEGHFLGSVLYIVLDQPAQHHDRVVLGQHFGLDSPLVGDEVGGNRGESAEAGHLLGNIQYHGVTLVDMGGHGQGDTDILPLDGLEGVLGAVATSAGVGI